MLDSVVHVTVKTERYRSENGEPSCRGDWEQGELCDFLEEDCTSDLKPYCRTCQVDLEERDSPEGGMVVPCSGCPVWGTEAGNVS